MASKDEQETSKRSTINNSDNTSSKAYFPDDSETIDNGDGDKQ
jgi:hypothetical protein